MRAKNILLGLLLTTLIVGCKKDEVPVQDDYYFTYEIKISNRISEPTIINGYYGHVLLFEGDFMPSTEGTAKAPDTVRNELYFYDADKLEALEAAKVQRDGVDFYDLRKLKKDDVTPKYIIKPNKKGFYQIDTNNQNYLVLIEVKKNLGYFNGGPFKAGHETTQLRTRNMNIDYNATF
ncbi:hypothetical protein [Roseivirga sp.]|uniref:hypothetical protein n=1 Tax=Roseivirga sp. TaxID=1964215 RepID=UPI003B51F95D